MPLILGAAVAVWQIAGNEGDSIEARAVLGVGGFTLGLAITVGRLVRGGSQPTEPLLRSRGDLIPLLATQAGGPGDVSLFDNGIVFEGSTTHHFAWFTVVDANRAPEGIVLNMAAGSGGGYSILVYVGRNEDDWRRALRSKGISI